MNICGQKSYSRVVFCLQVVNGDTGAMRVSNAQVSPLHDRLAATGHRASATQVNPIIVRTSDVQLEIQVFASLFLNVYRTTNAPVTKVY
jgi:hypothetical protein